MSASEENPTFRRQAERHFKRARQLALRDRISAWLSGRQEQRLLPFEAIRTELREKHPYCLGIRQVPLEKIVGSVARYDDFTRHFLPLKDSLRDRWINVESYAMRRGWPPVELYEVGDVYFVSDGNHRVAVARQMGYDTIEAYVWSFPGVVDIDPGESLDDVLIRLEEHNFMKRTGLDRRHPDHEICFTTPGRYRELLAQINRLRNTLAVIDGEPLPYPEAVDAWYEMVYLPAIQIIRESEVLETFPGRTEADLFVWLSVHRDILRQQYGEYDNIADLVEQVAQDWRKPVLEKAFESVLRLLGRELPPSPLPDLDREPT